MLIHPQFNPAAFELGPLAVRWYALSYIVGFVLFMWLGRRRIRQGSTPFTAEMLDDFLTWGVLGVILGGRLGFVLFYQPEYYFSHPAEIIKVWQGGMSFHGGFLGVVAASWLFARPTGVCARTTTPAQTASDLLKQTGTTAKDDAAERRIATAIPPIADYFAPSAHRLAPPAGNPSPRNSTDQ